MGPTAETDEAVLGPLARKAPAGNPRAGRPRAITVPRTWPIDPRAALYALASVAALAAAIFAGSGGMRHFDPALTHYAATTLVALGALVYRLTVWGSRPPTRRLMLRALRNLRETRRAKVVAQASSPVSSGTHAMGISPEDTGEDACATHPRDALLRLAALVLHTLLRFAGAFVGQDFIRRRGWVRWGTHVGLSYGSTLAFAFTFPLVFGWVHFETPDRPDVYNVVVLGLTVDSFHVGSLKALAAFNALNLSAVMVLVGCALATWRRLTDRGERAVQTFREDWVPILLLASVAATGLMLTASSRLLHGAGYAAGAVAHAATVIVLLLYIPFGKLLHMFQRAAALAVAVNKKAAETAPRAECRVCSTPFASAAQVEDLRATLADLGMRFVYAGPAGEVSYTEICPPCRRRLLAVNHARAAGR